ncbi:60s ribosomal L6 [Tubulinosema ratisbonensis]|uniref:60s ribosomal L6 n=1 Tax=Tubulinosema ratisbonensis TaxID=291195 RepID=A0A437AQ91_9MICR|nr:60s ribosomal L6 [Tubulinosema ratisbonensis]
MVDPKKNFITINNRKIRVLPECAGYYPADDMPEYMQILEKRNQPKERKPRSDLVTGMVVIVLEGEFAARRVVFLKQLPGNKALCCGPQPINKVPFFTIDERFLLKTSTILDISVNCDKIESKDVYDCMSEAEITENKTSEMKKVEDEILKAISKVKFMRTYLETLFNINENEGEVPTNF